MNVYIHLPNDEEFEFEADMFYYKGCEAKIWGPPENCYPEEPAEAEFANYGPYNCMYDAVYVACYVKNCSMTEQAMEQLAYEVEEQTIERYLCDI